MAESKKKTYPDKFTTASIIRHIGQEHDLPAAKAKEIVEDVFDIIEKGILSGERVPLGPFGKIFIHTKPATKARMGRNPATGEQIKIPAKKATQIPKMRFGKAFKDLVLKTKIKSKTK